MVRLVFRPYTQVRRSICTLEPLRTSTRVSPGFVLLRHSSPSFGSQHVCSHSNLSSEKSWSVDSAALLQASYLSSIRNLYFHFALGIRSRTLAHMLDSLVRVSRRVDEKHFVPVHQYTWQARPFPTWLMKRNLHNPETESRITASHRFLFSNFRYYFTLFSKFFSSFPHGTCSLSVSHPYLALEGIYLPIRAAIPNNSTHRKPSFSLPFDMNGAVTLHGVSFQTTLSKFHNEPNFL